MTKLNATKMKRLMLFAVFCLISLAACSQGGEKFVGIWEPLENKMLPKNFLLFIGSENGAYTFSTNQTKKTTTVEYLKSDDTLLGKIDGNYFVIRFLKKEKHILMMPQTRADPIEFRKASYSK